MPLESQFLEYAKARVEARRRVEEAERSGAKSLALGGLRIDELPARLRLYPQIEELNLSNTDIKQLPSWLKTFSDLVTLNVAWTPLTELPEWIGSFQRLQTLYLGGSKIAYLPTTLADSSELKVLDIHGTEVAELPETMSRLTNLWILDLGNSRIERLPDWISGFRELALLSLKGLPIDEVPESLRQLTMLQDLDLRDTPITRLPSWLSELRNLRNLELPGNLDFPPPEVVAQGTEAVLRYLRTLHEDIPEEQWRCKMVVAGEAEAGKTSLVRALLNQPHDPSEPMTHGVNVTDLALAHPSRADVTMHIDAWDFGGQRTYRSAHRFYMTDQSLFLLVFNCREEWDDRQMREWLKAISARAGSSPILLAGTHARAHRHGLPIATLRNDFPQIAPQVFYVDCEPAPDRLGIEELREAIAEHAATLSLMGQSWPRTWLSAVRAVTELPGNHAPVDTVDDTMQQAGLDDSASRNTLLAALHYRGEILHFAGEPEIADTVMLRPTWVDGHVTKILDSRDVLARDGLLSHTELKAAWPQTDPALRSHLVGLMEAFDLAYRVDSPNHDDLCLIVDRLPHDPPDYQATWDAARQGQGADEVRLVIDFGAPILLAGIPTWFIAREHRFTLGMHWRYGVLLYDRFDSGCHALLLADDSRGTVELTVRGVGPVRFLSVLKDGLLSPLRQRYPYLTWNIKVPCPCAEGNGEACGYLFDESYLQKVAARGRTTVECQETLAEVSVERLMYGLRPTALSEVVADLRAIDRKIDGLSQLQMQTLDYQRLTTAVQRARSESCPSVFTLSTRSKRLHTATEYRLRLFCEQPGAWHPLPNGQGVFTFDTRPDWLVACEPYLRVLLPLLQRALTLFVPVHGVAKAIVGPAPASAQDYVAELWSDKTLADELELARGLLDTLPSGLESSAAVPVDRGLVLGDNAPLRRAFGLADFRGLRRSLEALAPPGRDPWGGLTPMVTPEGLAVFVCEYHAKQYRYPRET